MFAELLQSRGSKTSWINFAFLCSMLCMWTSVDCWSYYYSNETMNWYEARVWCRAHYTDMVAIQNQDEVKYLNDFLPKKNTYYWIGIRKIKDIWTWVGTNKALTAEATSWAEGEPNNGRGSKLNQDCVEMYIKRKDEAGKWNDEFCGRKKTALCYTAACKNDLCLYGECVETINSHMCTCFDGFYGDKCDQVVECNRKEVTVPSKGSVNCTHTYGDFSYNSSCQYSCEEGYQLSMPRPSKCTASGNWSEQPPTCELVQCQELSRPARGSMKSSDPVGPSSYQSTRVFTCDEGYVLVGSPTLQCEATGLWNSTQPFCVAITCQNPEGEAHLITQCSQPLTELWPDSNCSFSCEAGFELQGARTIQCSDDGQWSQAIPTCKTPPSPTTAVASGVAASSALLSGMSLAMWVLKRLKQKADKFELNSNSDIEVPPQVYKNSIDSLI